VRSPEHEGLIGKQCKLDDLLETRSYGNRQHAILRATQLDIRYASAGAPDMKHASDIFSEDVNPLLVFGGWDHFASAAAPGVANMNQNASAYESGVDCPVGKRSKRGAVKGPVFQDGCAASITLDECLRERLLPTGIVGRSQRVSTRSDRLDNVTRDSDPQHLSCGGAV
jgi:hypothetical protein